MIRVCRSCWRKATSTDVQLTLALELTHSKRLAKIECNRAVWFSLLWLFQIKRGILPFCCSCPIQAAKPSLCLSSVHVKWSTRRSLLVIWTKLEKVLTTLTLNCKGHDYTPQDRQRRPRRSLIDITGPEIKQDLNTGGFVCLPKYHKPENCFGIKALPYNVYFLCYAWLILKANSWPANGSVGDVSLRKRFRCVREINAILVLTRIVLSWLLC